MVTAQTTRPPIQFCALLLVHGSKHWLVVGQQDQEYQGGRQQDAIERLHPRFGLTRFVLLKGTQRADDVADMLLVEYRRPVGSRR